MSYRGRRGENREDEAYQEPREDFEYVIDFSPEIPQPGLLRVDRDPLVMWAEHTAIPVEFWQELGVKVEGDRHISFNWPDGWKKVRNVLLRTDVVTTKNRRINRFHWASPPPGKVHPLWPPPDDEDHPEIWLTEGESDCAVLRFLGFDAYTFGAATNIPTDIELRMLDLMGVKRAVLLYDADPPGRLATEKVADAIGNWGIGTEGKEAIDVLTVNIGPTLSRWKYCKDARDLFNHLSTDETTAVLQGERDTLLMNREEDISAGVVVERAATPTWRWDGLIAAAALNMLYGPPKAGKTTLTYHMIKAMGGADGTGDATGEPDNSTSLLSRPVIPQRVLYYSEMPASFDRQAMMTICGGPLRNLWLRNSGDRVFDGMAWPQIVMQLERDVTKYKIDYVVIDTVIEWFKFNSEEMYDAAVVGKKLSLLRRLTTKGVTVQINHHPPKAGGSPFGSVAFQGYVDCLIEMERDEQGTTLSTIGRLRSNFSSVKYGFADDEGKELAVLKIEDRGDRDTDADRLSVSQVAGLKARIIAVLPYPPGAMAQAQLLEDEVISQAGPKQLRTRLAELVRSGLIARNESETGPTFTRLFGMTVTEKGSDA